MSRPCKCRRVCCMPGATYFKPEGIPLRELEENQLSVEEMEAVRLRDIEHLEQAEAAKEMNVSRATFQRILLAARGKVADSLLNGKALRVGGGNYELAANHTSIEPNKEIQKLIERGNMKIAVISDEGKTISQHFGRAPLYIVFNIEDGKITTREERPKMGHQHFAGHDESHGASGQPHGYDQASQDRHAGMAGAISDCQVLIGGGMGMGAYDSLKSYGIEPIITDERDPEKAVKLFVAGKLQNLMERLH